MNEGDALEDAGPVTLRVRSNAPASYLTMLWRDGELLTTAHDEVDLARSAPGGPAIYRAAIVAPPELGSIPWVVSNPIYVGVDFPRSVPVVNIVSAFRSIFDGTAKWWRTETDAMSKATIETEETPGGIELRMVYSLSSPPALGQYASLAVELPNGAAPYDRVTFSARSERPLRILVQLQTLGRKEGWQRSVYLDTSDREQKVRFDQATPIGSTRTPHPDATLLHDILFVVDTTHTKPGTSGRLWLKTATLQVGRTFSRAGGAAKAQVRTVRTK